MLYGGSCWSELPISAYKLQELNGDVFAFDFVIDQILDNSYQIDQIFQPVVIIDQDLKIDTAFGQIVRFDLALISQNSFTLDAANE
jgi:hypothetical protein